MAALVEAHYHCNPEAGKVVGARNSNLSCNQKVHQGQTADCGAVVVAQLRWEDRRSFVGVEVVSVAGKNRVVCETEPVVDDSTHLHFRDRRLAGHQIWLHSLSDCWPPMLESSE